MSKNGVSPWHKTRQIDALRIPRNVRALHGWVLQGKPVSQGPSDRIQGVVWKPAHFLFPHDSAQVTLPPTSKIGRPQIPGFGMIFTPNLLRTKHKTWSGSPIPTGAHISSCLPLSQIPEFLNRLSERIPCRFCLTAVLRGLRGQRAYIK